MILPKNFFRPVSQEAAQPIQANSASHRDAQGKMHVAFYTDLFSKAAEMPLWSNAMHKTLQNDIEASIQLLNTREKVVVDIYEPTETDELDRERALIGFRKYMNDCYLGSKKQNAAHLMTFSVFLLIGIFLILYLYGIEPTWLPQWVFVLIDTIAAVFMWQFVGYMAFILPAERRAMRRIRQMIALEYEFHHWN